MSFLFKNCEIRINDNSILASSFNIDQNTNLKANFIAGEKFTTSYSAQSQIKGRIDITYPLTGYDKLAENIINDNFCTIKFGNIYIQSGYLSKYSFRVSPNSIIDINANFDFFETFTGNLSFQQTGLQFNRTKAINTTGITLNPLIGEILLNPNNIQYNYSSNIIPVYQNNSGTSSINRIYVDNKQVKTQISANIISGYLPSTGIGFGVGININNIQNFIVSGIITDKQFSVDNNGLLQSNLTIQQDYVGQPPIITGISTQTIDENITKTITVYGDNFIGVTDVSISDSSMINYSVDNKNTITIYNQQDLISGLLSIKTINGKYIYQNPMSVLYNPVIINDFNPKQFYSGQKITIFGDNFYRISDISAGNITGQFEIYDKKTILFTAPDVSSGIISVGSTLRNNTGISTSTFYEYPIISSFTPTSGKIQDVILISGKNIGNTTELRFNGINSIFGILNNSGISGFIPTGNIYGPISIKTSQGASYISKSNLFPSLYVTGLLPLSSGQTGTAITITGKNITGDYMFNINNKYMVSFNGQITFFDYTNNALTGLIPANVNNGPVYIYTPDGASVYDSNVYFQKIPSKPYINSIIYPFQSFSGSNTSFSILGQNLSPTKRVLVTGTSFIGGLMSQVGFIISGNYINTDILGMKINVTNFPLNQSNGINYYSTGVDLIPIVETSYGTGYAPFINALRVYSGIL